MSFPCTFPCLDVFTTSRGLSVHQAKCPYLNSDDLSFPDNALQLLQDRKERRKRRRLDADQPQQSVNAFTEPEDISMPFEPVRNLHLTFGDSYKCSVATATPPT